MGEDKNSRKTTTKTLFTRDTIALTAGWLILAIALLFLLKVVFL